MHIIGGTLRESIWKKLNKVKRISIGRDIAQAVSRWLPTGAARVRARVCQV
jgi:hypothetical protein